MRRREEKIRKETCKLIRPKRNTYNEREKKANKNIPKNKTKN